MPSEPRRRRRSRSRSKSPHRHSRTRSAQSRRSPVVSEDRHKRRRDDRNRQSKEDDRRRRDRNGEHGTRNVRVKKEPVDEDGPRRPRNQHATRDTEPTAVGAQRAPKVEGGADEEAKPREKPNFAVSGKLAEDTNTYNGIVIKYNEPTEARKPKKRWRLYPFKGDKDLPMLPIHRQSAYLLGRERKVADIPIDHPSCSKQHAVLQFRLVSYKREDGTQGKRIRPYLIDLDSSNGSYVNNQRIEPRRYVELLERDVMKFGYSSREYVLLHEESKGGEDSDASLGAEEGEGGEEEDEDSQEADMAVEDGGENPAVEDVMAP